MAEVSAQLLTGAGGGPGGLAPAVAAGGTLPGRPPPSAAVGAICSSSHPESRMQRPLPGGCETHRQQQRSGDSREHRENALGLPGPGKGLGKLGHSDLQGSKEPLLGSLNSGRPPLVPASRGSISGRRTGPSPAASEGHLHHPHTATHTACFISSWPLAPSGIIFLMCLFTSSLSVFCLKSEAHSNIGGGVLLVSGPPGPSLAPGSLVSE